MDQLLDIELRGVDRSKVGTHRLSLYRELYLLVGNILAHGSIEPVRLSTSPRGGPATTVKKNDIDTIGLRNTRQFLLGLVDCPVRHQIAAILRSIGKSQHDRLHFAPLRQMLAVVLVLI